MRLIALPILLLMFVLIAFGNSLSRNQSATTPDVHDYRYAEPFRGTEGGQMLVRACGNCHSNQTNLPWYGHVVPISWWIDKHVRAGREALNFSEWRAYSARLRHNELESLCGAVSTGRMPPASYRILHPESRLKAQDKKVICAWADNELDDDR
jgi:Haem-binding domain